MSAALLVLTLAVLMPGQAQSGFLAGASRVSITPDPSKIRYTLGGYASPTRYDNPATGVLDTCCARALVVSHGGRKAALVSVELCFIPATLTQAVEQRVAANGFSRSNLLLAATHTHAGPEPLCLIGANTLPAGKLPTFSRELLDFIADAVARAILEADQRKAAASMAAAVLPKVGLNRNRRGERITDDDLTLLRLTGADGKVIALVANYAAHPVYYGDAMLQVSGDWCGAYQRQLEAILPGTVALFINGAEGDVSPHAADEGTDTDKIQTYSAKLVTRTRDAMALLKPAPVTVVRSWLQPVDLPQREPHPFFVLAAARFGASPQQARELIGRLMPEKTNLTFLQIGGALVMGMPGEPTTPVGLAAKADARKAGVLYPMVSALTNDWLGYIVTAEQYRAGKYEPTMSFYGERVGEVALHAVRSGLGAIRPAGNRSAGR